MDGRSSRPRCGGLGRRGWGCRDGRRGLRCRGRLARHCCRWTEWLSYSSCGSRWQSLEREVKMCRLFASVVVPPLPFHARALAAPTSCNPLVPARLMSVTLQTLHRPNSSAHLAQSAKERLRLSTFLIVHSRSRVCSGWHVVLCLVVVWVECGRWGVVVVRATETLQGNRRGETAPRSATLQKVSGHLGPSGEMKGSQIQSENLTAECAVLCGALVLWWKCKH